MSRPSNPLHLALKALDRADALLRQACAALAGDLDSDQIALYDLAFCRAELAAARSAWQAVQQESVTDSLAEQALGCFTADALVNLRTRLGSRLSTYGLSLNTLEAVDQDFIDAHLSAAALESFGRALCERDSPRVDPELDPEQALVRDSFRSFARDQVAPLAERIHRQDLIVPEALLAALRELGCFGLSVPTRYGGLMPDEHDDSRGMVLVTEELSHASLGAAGSLITRPEILARALLQGGTEAQRQRHLPALASGETLCAIAVTEPGTGSDVASVSLRARPVDGGWRLSGGKTWCTFAGKAGLLLVLARTEADAGLGHRGLSLFLVEKPATDGHDIDYASKQGGSLSGRAIPTLGYRGMHSFELFFDDLFVPASHLVGEQEGRGKGFYYTMRGFMGGRLQTAARACGLMQAAIDAAHRYAGQREVFGRPVADYPLSLAKFARMAATTTVCRYFTQAAARAMDEGAGAQEAALVKLLACRAAEWVTRDAQQLHGGMGYAEETAASRYFVDARVLSIFEGAEETLAIRVIGKALLEDVRSNLRATA